MVSRSKGVSAIHLEQLQLVKIQAELEAILVKVNEAVNSLKVEELQLKSSAVAAIANDSNLMATSAECSEMPGSSFKTERNDNCIDRYELFEVDEVNKQEIDLDMFVKNIKHSMETEEEESD